MGFKNIDGVDPSQGMLDLAAQKNAYRKLDDLFCGRPETFPSKYHNKYDVITASGVLADGHLDSPVVFDEMMLALKQGGIAIFIFKKVNLENFGYGAYMDKLT